MSLATSKRTLKVDILLLKVKVNCLRSYQLGCTSTLHLFGLYLLWFAECLRSFMIVSPQVVSVGSYTKPLIYKGKEKGTITVSQILFSVLITVNYSPQINAEEVSQSKSLLTLNLSARGLDKKVCLQVLFCYVLICYITQDFFGKSDPYLEFSKENPDGSFSAVHRTQVRRGWGVD